MKREHFLTLFRLFSACDPALRAAGCFDYLYTDPVSGTGGLMHNRDGGMDFETFFDDIDEDLAAVETALRAFKRLEGCPGLATHPDAASILLQAKTNLTAMKLETLRIKEAPDETDLG